MKALDFLLVISLIGVVFAYARKKYYDWQLRKLEKELKDYE